MSEIYKNVLTNSILEEDNILSNDSGGIVYSNKNNWNYIPAEYIKTEDVIDNDDLYEPENIPEYNLINDDLDKINNPEAVVDYYTEKAQYIFGFQIKNTKVYTEAKTSAIISREIDLGNFSYVMLETDETTDNNSIIEYSILSGNKDIPIVPTNHSDVITEKMFYGLDTRFIADNSTEKSVIYEDGKETAKTAPTFEDFEKHDYKIKYKAGGEIYKIIPPESKIKIKIIIRNSGSVNNIVLKKYGGEAKWI